MGLVGEVLWVFAVGIEVGWRGGGFEIAVGLEGYWNIVEVPIPPIGGVGMALAILFFSP